MYDYSDNILVPAKSEKSIIKPLTGSWLPCHSSLYVCAPHCFLTTNSLKRLQLRLAQCSTAFRQWLHSTGIKSARLGTAQVGCLGRIETAKGFVDVRRPPDSREARPSVHLRIAATDGWSADCRHFSTPRGGRTSGTRWDHHLIGLLPPTVVCCLRHGCLAVPLLGAGVAFWPGLPSRPAWLMDASEVAALDCVVNGGGDDDNNDWECTNRVTRCRSSDASSLADRFTPSWDCSLR